MRFPCVCTTVQTIRPEPCLDEVALYYLYRVFTTNLLPQAVRRVRSSRRYSTARAHHKLKSHQNSNLWW